VINFDLVVTFLELAILLPGKFNMLFLALLKSTGTLAVNTFSPSSRVVKLPDPSASTDTGLPSGLVMHTYTSVLPD
jgi:hypothetical protein